MNKKKNKKKSKIHEYWIMDGRARFDQDRAVICEICDSLSEARANCSDYGDAVVIDPETNKIAYDPELFRHGL
jgi:hypothetical protein